MILPVIRIEKTKNYTVMSNFHLRDKNLSNKAVGLMCKILSLPEDWDYTINGLSAICKDGRDGIASQIKELERAGYLRREQSRACGKFGDIEYILTEKPFTGKPFTGKPITGNPTQLNTKELSTNKTSTKSKRKAFTPPLFEEVLAYVMDKGLNVDAKRFFDYYEAGDWHDAKGKPVKNWKQKCITWDKHSPSQPNKDTTKAVREEVTMSPEEYRRQQEELEAKARAELMKLGE